MILGGVWIHTVYVYWVTTVNSIIANTGKAMNWRSDQASLQTKSYFCPIKMWILDALEPNECVDSN